MSIAVKAIRAILEVEADAPISVYTGKLVKTLLYTLFKELRLYRGLRGVVSPIHVSPLFTPGRREWELGELVAPRYRRGGEGPALQPVELGGEYIVHIGGEAGLVERAGRLLERVKTPLQVKVGDALVVYRLLGERDVTGDLAGRELGGDRVTIYFKAPARFFNVYTASRLPKFSVSAPEVLMTPYMFYRGQPTMTGSLLLEAGRLLGLLVETYYVHTTLKPFLVPFNGTRAPGIVGKATYIVDTRDDGLKARLAAVLSTAEIVGVGESRANGFGTVAWAPK